MPTYSLPSAIETYVRGMIQREDILLWAQTSLAKYLSKSPMTTEAIEHIIDWLASDKAPGRVSRLSVAQAIVASEKWTKNLQKKGNNIKEESGDTQVVLDFKDGFKFVKLVGEAAYKREGALMRHCVSSYFGREVEVYSLRDKNNDPHCTIEKDKQIKGKGNGDIHPKYIDYVVRFLEHTGMDVRDSEMSHLGYDSVPFGRYVKTKLYRDKYAVKGSVVEYKDGVRIFDDKTKLFNYQGDDVCLFRGDLVIEKREKITHKALAEVSGYVYVQEGATLTVPKLTEAGSVDVREGATLTVPKLTEAGYVYVLEGATLTVPKLTEAGYVDVRGTLNAPLLK